MGWVSRSAGPILPLQHFTTAIGRAAAGLRVNDLQERHTGDRAERLGISFDEETTFSLSANTRITVDEFVYQQSGSANAALFTVTRGTAAFLASKVASTGDMKIATPIAIMGIRGTTGVVDVPQAGTAGEPKIKLYPDADGHVGRIEVFDRQGARLGTLTQGSSAFALRGPDLAAASRQSVPDSAAGSVTRPRRAAAALCLAHNRSASDDPAPAITRAQPATAERVAATGRPARAAKHSREPRRARPTREPGTPGPLRAAPRKPSPSGQKRK